MRRALAATGVLLALITCAAPAAMAGPRAPGFASYTPVISGTPTVGQVLSIAPVPGAAIQWTRNGTSISGATSTTYTLVSADGGATVNVSITLAGVTVSSGGAQIGKFFFPTGQDLILAAATL